MALRDNIVRVDRRVGVAVRDAVDVAVDAAMGNATRDVVNVAVRDAVDVAVKKIDRETQ